MVAVWGPGNELTVAEANRLAAEIRPAPVGAEALDWAIDVHLAADELASDQQKAAMPPDGDGAKVAETGAPNRTPESLIASYAQWLDKHGIAAGKAAPDPERVRAVRDELRSRANLRPGPCFPDY